MGRYMTILYRLRDRNPADDGVCPIGGARDRSMRTLTRWVAVLALCPGCHLDASASIPVVCEHCITSHLCTTHLSGVTPRNDKHWCRRAALARRARGRYCASLGDNVPLSTALPLINKQMWGHMPLDRRANVPCDNTRPQPVNQVAMSCGALHPLRGATPVMWRYTRSERVQCPRIGCTALADRNDRGTWNPTTRQITASTPHPTQNPGLDGPASARDAQAFENVTRCDMFDQSDARGVCL